MLFLLLGFVVGGILGITLMAILTIGSIADNNNDIQFSGKRTI